MRAYLGVVDGQISVSDFDEQIDEVSVRTQDELNDALLPYCDEHGNCSFQHSSSMDFPEEYTDDSVVLDTIEWIMDPSNYAAMAGLAGLPVDEDPPDTANVQDIIDLASTGLHTDGAHHKQWILEQILTRLGVDLSDITYEEGIAP